MTVLDELNFDSMTDGNPISLTGDWSSAGATPISDDAAAIHGTLGCRFATTGSFARVQYDSGANQTAARVWSFYFKVQTFASVVHYIATIYTLTSGGSIVGDWRINTGHTVSIRDQGVSVATSAETLSTGVAYRAEWKIDPTADTQELRIYEGESETPYFTLSGSWSSDDTRVFTFGPSSAASGGAIDYDTVKYADDWVGPEVPPVSLTPVLHRYYFHNGQWV